MLGFGYKTLSEGRRQHIDVVVENLERKYSTGSGMDFELLAQDSNIGFIESSKIAGEYAVHHNGRDYLFIGTHYIPSVRNSDVAHGLGHIILQFREGVLPNETEANYFAEKLTGTNNSISFLLLIPDSMLNLIRHPKSVIKYFLKLDETTINELIDEFDSR